MYFSVMIVFQLAAPNRQGGESGQFSLQLSRQGNIGFGLSKTLDE